MYPVKIDFETFVRNLLSRSFRIEGLNRDSITGYLVDGEIGCAKLLHKIVGDLLVYDHQEKSWYWYNNLYWQRQDASNILDMAKKILLDCYECHIAGSKLKASTIRNSLIFARAGLLFGIAGNEWSA